MLHSHIYRGAEHVFHAGNNMEAVYIVKSGAIKSYITNHAGEEQILNFYTPGDVLGLDGLATKKYTSSAYTLQTSAVCAIPIQQLEKILTHLLPDGLLKLTIEKLKRDSRNVALLNKKNAKTRIAAFLLDIAENCKAHGYSPKDFALSMSRDDIGNYLGLASETVSRTFTKMQESGWVKLDRRRVTIVDAPHLYQLADN